MSAASTPEERYRKEVLQEYYEEGRNLAKSEFIYLGNLGGYTGRRVDPIFQQGPQTLYPLLKQLEDKKIQIGHVFRPEIREKDNEAKRAQSWRELGGSAELRPSLLEDEFISQANLEFMRGVISKARPVALVTPITYYSFVNWTSMELKWLYDSGYTFTFGDVGEPYPVQGCVIARAPDEPNEAALIEKPAGMEERLIVADLDRITIGIIFGMEVNRSTLMPKNDILAPIITKFRDLRKSMRKAKDEVKSLNKQGITTWYDRLERLDTLELVDKWIQDGEKVLREIRSQVVPPLTPKDLTEIERLEAGIKEWKKITRELNQKREQLITMQTKDEKQSGSDHSIDEEAEAEWSQVARRGSRRGGGGGGAFRGQEDEHVQQGRQRGGFRRGDYRPERDLPIGPGSWRRGGRGGGRSAFRGEGRLPMGPGSWRRDGGGPTAAEGAAAAMAAGHPRRDSSGGSVGEEQDDKEKHGCRARRSGSSSSSSSSSSTSASSSVSEEARRPAWTGRGGRGVRPAPEGRVGSKQGSKSGFEGRGGKGFGRGGESEPS